MCLRRALRTYPQARTAGVSLHLEDRKMRPVLRIQTTLERSQTSKLRSIQPYPKNTTCFRLKRSNPLSSTGPSQPKESALMRPVCSMQKTTLRQEHLPKEKICLQIGSISAAATSTHNRLARLSNRTIKHHHHNSALTSKTLTGSIVNSPRTWNSANNSKHPSMIDLLLSALHLTHPQVLPSRSDSLRAPPRNAADAAKSVISPKNAPAP